VSYSLHPTRKRTNWIIIFHPQTKSIDSENSNMGDWVQPLIAIHNYHWHLKQSTINSQCFGRVRYLPNVLNVCTGLIDLSQEEALSPMGYPIRSHLGFYIKTSGYIHYQLTQKLTSSKGLQDGLQRHCNTCIIWSWDKKSLTLPWVMFTVILRCLGPELCTLAFVHNN
jgi:hypothetical protein